MNQLEAENRRLRLQLRQLKEDGLSNQRLMQKYHQRELDLLTAETLPELLECLTDGLHESFRVDAISLALQDPDHELRHLLSHTGTPPEAFQKVLFTDDLGTLSPVFEGLHRPLLGPYLYPDHRTLFPGEKNLRSVALMPLTGHRQLIGSLNLGSSDPRRYSRHFATDFQHRLGILAAVCLENASNRERIVLSGLTDALTGLQNRRYLEKRLGEELSRASRYRQPLSCLFIDADHFKRINDSFGHACGDSVLRELAQRVRSQLRSSDIAVRYGGEEIALLLPQTDGIEASNLAERIRLEVSTIPISVDGDRDLFITVSIGVSEYMPHPGQGSFERLGRDLLTRADAALYRAKAEGRNRVVFNRTNVRDLRDIAAGKG